MTQLILGTGNSAPKFCSIPGYEVVDVGVAAGAIGVGQLVIRTASGWSAAPINTLDAHGVALRTYAAGQGGCDFLIQGEMDGYDTSGGLVPGTALYPSASVAGGIQTDVVANAPVRMRAVTTGRVRFNFV